MRKIAVPFGAAAALALSLTVGGQVASAHQAGPAPSTQAAQPAIIGGQYDSTPWSADVHYTKDGHGGICSGAIIAAQWVLTAGHCSGDNEVVYVGNPQLKSGTKGTVDKKYTDPSTKGDLLLLHLSSPVRTTYLALGSSNPPIGSTVQIWGWGDTTQGGSHSDRLKSGHMKVKGTNCTDVKGGPALCLVKGPDISAKGDSGGPALYNGIEVGLDSRGDDTTKSYAQIAPHRAWIKKTAGV
ncbi:S1 family peptidase [Streptomyces sp. NPDC006703]|uniref:S1 family peptidase n=1 Tax=Streptomyces sp. NPDC006703 TaxID=3364759 RepID=UPI0036756DFD